MAPEDDALDHIPESIELTRAEAGRILEAMAEALEALPAGPARDELQATKRIVIAKLSPWLGGLLDDGD